MPAFQSTAPGVMLFWPHHGGSAPSMLRVAPARPPPHGRADRLAPTRLGLRAGAATSGAAGPGPDQRDARPRSLRVRAPGAEADELRSGQRVDHGRADRPAR